MDAAMEFLLSFRVVNKSNQVIEGAHYAVTIELNSDDPTSNTTTENYTMDFDYSGLSEPEHQPLVIQTDLESFTRIFDVDTEGDQLSITCDIQHPVKVRVRVGANGIRARVEETTLQSLLDDWVRDCHGHDLRSFADTSDTELMMSLEEYDRITVGDDVRPRY